MHDLNWRDTVTEQQQTVKYSGMAESQKKICCCSFQNRFEVISVFLCCVNDCESPRRSAVVCAYILKIRLD